MGSISAHIVKSVQALKEESTAPPRFTRRMELPIDRSTWMIDFIYL